jgi:exopolyphosphatase/guanosine-5'-triphosphate,3'-diphosphate pyrophosphatase
LPAATVRRLLDELAAESADERCRRPGMEPQRADVIVGGLIVLDALLARFDLPECLTSEADILDGLVRTLLDRGQ